MKYVALVVFVLLISMMITGNRSLGGEQVLLLIAVLAAIVLYKLFTQLTKIQSLLQELNRKVDLISKKRNE
jgi:hypothetical protein